MILEAFLLSLNCVVILLILGGAGYVTAARGWYDKSSRVLLARLVTFLSLPAYLFSSVMQTLDHDGLLTLVGSMATPFISIWTCFLLSRIIARVCHVEGVHSGVFSSAFTATNNMFIGLPVSLALFGTEAMVPTLLYFFANTTFFWTVGNYMEAADGRLATMQKPQKVFSAQTFKRIFTPPLLGFLTAIVFILLDFTPPKAIMDAAHYMGGITTPLALVFVGCMLYNIGIRNIRVTKDMLWVYIGRFDDALLARRDPCVDDPRDDAHPELITADLPTYSAACFFESASNSSFLATTSARSRSSCSMSRSRSRMSSSSASISSMNSISPSMLLRLSAIASRICSKSEAVSASSGASSTRMPRRTGAVPGAQSSSGDMKGSPVLGPNPGGRLLKAFFPSAS